MKTLGNLKPSKGSRKNKKRIGRGHASGWGKTAAKGHKGQKARKGGTVAAGFEGGQMPLYRRLPKRGFSNPFRVEYNALNLEALGRFDGSAEITPETLAKAGLLRMPKNPVKILGEGEVKHPLKLRVHKASAKAKSAIEQAGGSIEFIVVEKKPVVKNKTRPKKK